ncbi:MAG TPA: metal ABC transporter permease [Thermoanaerobaculia bacterium]|jgi:ABC-type Mn2+/Zn2+ transport system permease subunit|nr:metal ABC transporter permease [Thermoanaerobaculia bacterium]
MSAQIAYALVLALATAAVSGIVGSFALMKRMTLAGDAVSHLALPGLGLAFLWRIQPLAGAAVTLAIGILLIDRLQRRTGLATETSIGVVFTAGLALGTLLTPREDLIDALFGGFTPLSLRGFLLGLAGCAVVTLAVFAMRERLILIIFSPDIARSVGIAVERVNFLFLAAFGLTILLGLQYLGALLVGAIIIVPAAAGRRLARSLDSFLVISAGVGMLSVAIGFAVAARWHLAEGPAIVSAAAVIFGVSLVKK